MIESNLRFKNVDEVFEFLESRDKYGSQLGLKRIEHLLKVLGNPEEKVDTIHIAGTNGKGSVGAYLESIFRQCGMKTFHFSSPAVFDRRDPWRRCGKPLSEMDFISCASHVYAAVKEMEQLDLYPTRFEIETALAFYAAASLENDLLILETGLGGQQDATNVLQNPKVCVFTNISYDHMQFLGDTLTEIATEKAGIIKAGCKVFSAEQDPEVKAVLDEKMIYGNVNYVANDAIELLSYQPGNMKFEYKGKVYETSLSGLYQLKNAALAIEVAREWGIFEEVIKAGIGAAKWDGRFQVLSKEPYFIIDGAHNIDAIEQLAQTVQKSFTKEPINFIIGILKDKEHEKMVERIAPLANCIFTVTPPNARGMNSGELAEEIRQWNSNVIACKTIEEAVALALKQKVATLAFGSLSYLGEVKKCHDNYLKSRKDYD